MAWTKETSNSITDSATISLSVTAGDLILVLGVAPASTITAYTFSDGVNTYNTVMQQILGGTNGRTRMSLAWTKAATTATLTITASGGLPDQIHAGSFRHGADTLNPSVDVKGYAFDIQNTDIATTVANTLVFAASEATGANSPGAGATALGDSIVNTCRVTSEVYLADNSPGVFTANMDNGSPERGVIAVAFTVNGGGDPATVTLDASSFLTPFSIAQNPTWTHNPVGVPTGVGIAVTLRDVSQDCSITSVTYGGQTCTLEDSQIAEAGNIIVALYSLANPPSGPQTVQINLNTAPDRGVAGWAVTVLGGSTTDVFSAVAKARATDSSPSLSVASDTDELVMSVLSQGGGSLAGSQVGSGQTLRYNEVINSGIGHGSTKKGASPTVTMSYTLSLSLDWGQIAASFNPAGAAAQQVVPARKMKIWAYG